MDREELEAVLTTHADRVESVGLKIADEVLRLAGALEALLAIKVRELGLEPLPETDSTETPYGERVLRAVLNRHTLEQSQADPETVS